jgi:hypothetical protein
MALHPDTGTALSPRDLLRAMRRALGLSPMQRVLRELQQRGVNIPSLNAIEVFGGCAKRHTLDYASRVAHLEAWEIDPTCETALRKNISNATIRIVDSYQQIRQTSEHFDLIVVDNPASEYDRHFEHFELFPDIFRLVGNSALIVINVIPKTSPGALKKLPNLFNQEHLAARRRFYETERPEDISWAQIVSAYQGQAEMAGFKLEWHFCVRRHFIYYLVLKISRT